MPDTSVAPRCRCGHPESTHSHYRDGSDCAVCDYCRAYRPDDRAPSKLGAGVVGVCALPLIVLVAMAAHTYAGGWASAALLAGIGAVGVWLIVQPEKEDR